MDGELRPTKNHLPCVLRHLVRGFLHMDDRFEKCVCVEGEELGGGGGSMEG